MLTYPKIPAEGAVFREQFINDQYVADNGGTAVGAPTISNGVTLDGTTQYLTYGGRFLENKQNLSIEMSFMPDFAYDEDVIRILFDSPASHRYSIIKFDNAGSNVLRINLGNIALDIASATYSGYWNVGGMNHLMICADGTNTSVYLNNNVIANETAHSWTPKVPTTVYIGSNNSGVQWFDGQVSGVNVYNRKYTTAEVADRFSQLTFREPTTENSELWLPLRSHYYDSGVSKEVTTNLGNINSDQIWWGDGTTATTFPTQLTPNGIYCASGANPDYVRTPKTFTTTAGESYSFSFLAQPTGTLAGNDYLFSVKQSSSEGLSLAILAANGKMTFFCDGGTGLVDDDSMGEGAGLYHVAVVLEYNGANYDSYLYKDGELVDSSLGHAGFTPAAGNAMIAVGADYDGGQGFQGNIHFPIFMRTALTLTQIKWLHQRMFNELNI